MEKYRRWTDEKVGINPFVVANNPSAPLLGRALALVLGIVKLVLLLQFLPAFVFLYLLPINWLKQKAARVLLLFFGVYAIQDYSLEKVDKTGKCTRILSNHSCFIDVAYYLYRFPGCSFLGFSQDNDGKTKYFLISGLKALFLSFFKLQVFYRNEPVEGYQTVGELIKGEFGGSKSAKLIVFYEKIRTNGKGTIRVEKSLCDELYGLSQDCLIVQVRYAVRREELFSLTGKGLSVMLAALGTVTPGNDLKVRATRQDAADTHSSNQLKEAISTMASGPLVETEARSFSQFRDFYEKTQKEEYKLG